MRLSVATAICAVIALLSTTQMVAAAPLPTRSERIPGLPENFELTIPGLAVPSHAQRKMCDHSIKHLTPDQKKVWLHEALPEFMTDENGGPRPLTELQLVRVTAGRNPSPNENKCAAHELSLVSLRYLS